MDTQLSYNLLLVEQVAPTGLIISNNTVSYKQDAPMGLSKYGTIHVKKEMQAGSIHEFLFGVP